MKIKDIVRQSEKFEELEDMAREIESALKTIEDAEKTDEPLPYGMVYLSGGQFSITVSRSISLSAKFFERAKTEIVSMLQFHLASIREEQEALEV